MQAHKQNSLLSSGVNICKLGILSASPNIYMYNGLYMHLDLQNNSSHTDIFYWMLSNNNFGCIMK